MPSKVMTFDVRDSRFHQVVAADTEIEQVATGFRFTEGPAWHTPRAELIFSDIIGDTMYRWSRERGVSVFRQPSHMANGNTFDREWRLLTCEHATSRVTRTNADGGIEVLVSHYGGKELNSPNDIVVNRNGDIFFTDPPSGRSETYGVLRAQELPFQGVYRLNPQDRSLTPLVDDFAKPNGLCFSLDETRLFVNDTARFHIRVFDVKADGTLSNGRLWAETTGEGAGVPDGMKIDSAGMLFCCAQGGVHVFDERANCLGVIRTPEPAANLCWGDDDRRSLYITAKTSLYHLRVQTPGPIDE